MSGSRLSHRLVFGLIASLGTGLAACGTDAGGEAAAGGASSDVGTGGALGDVGTGGAPASSDVLQWTAITLSQPAGDTSLVLGALFNDALQKRTIILLTKLDPEGGTIEAGSGSVVEGADTAMDPTDDVFAWRTEGECVGTMGTETSPCTFNRGTAPVESVGGPDGPVQTTESRLEINAYSTEFNMVVRLRAVGLVAERDDCAADLCASFVGAITVSDAERTIFEQTPGRADTKTDLKTFMTNFSAMPDTETLNDAGMMEAAYTYAGRFEAYTASFRD